MKLIQISAWNDSGGGFLNRLLDGHPDLAPWPFELLLGPAEGDVDGFGDDWFRSRFRWPRLGRVQERSGAELFDLISDLELKSVLRDPGSAKHRDFPIDVDLAKWRYQVDETWNFLAERTQASFLKLYIETFLALQSPDAALNSKSVLGHCPVAILDAPETWADFPDTKFVHVVRSPVTGFADMRQRHPSLDPASYATKWSLVNGTAALFGSKYPDRVMLTHLLALLSDRSREISRILSWLGLASSDITLAPSWRGRRIDSAEMGPFGGVPVAVADAEFAKSEMVSEDIRGLLLDETRSVRRLLQAQFGITFPEEALS